MSLSSVQEIPLWPGPAPQSLGTAPQDMPSLFFYPAANATSAVIICPGGGYAGLSMETEGSNVAEWLQTRGVTALVLKYRLPTHGYRHPVPLLDAQRAVRLVRARAAEWKLDPGKIGLMGFSAGGHLASTAQTHFNSGDAQASDPVERVSSRPDFSILIYPVITFKDPLANAFSRDHLLGPNPESSLIENLSTETQVTKETPPTYLMAPQDDPAVPWENSQIFYQALQQHGVPARLKLYPVGGHGFGYYREQAGPIAGWLEDVGEWLKSSGWGNT